MFQCCRLVLHSDECNGYVEQNSAQPILLHPEQVCFQQLVKSSILFLDYAIATQSLPLIDGS